MARLTRVVFRGIGLGCRSDDTPLDWGPILREALAWNTGQSMPSPAAPTVKSDAKRRPVAFLGIGQGASGGDAVTMWDRALQAARGVPC
jgi:hypothetical protein